MRTVKVIMSFVITLLFVQLAFLGYVRGQNNPDSYKPGMPGYELKERSRAMNNSWNECLSISDSLLIIAEKENFPMAAAYAYEILADYYFYRDTLKSIFYLKKKLSHSQKYNIEHCIFDAYLTIGTYYIAINDPYSAYTNSIEMGNEAEERNSDYGRVRHCQALARLYKSRGDLVRQHRALLKCLEYIDNIDEDERFSVYVQIADWALRNDSLRFKYLNKAIVSANNVKDSQYVYVNMACHYARVADKAKYDSIWYIYDTLSKNHKLLGRKSWIKSRKIYDAMFSKNFKLVDSLIDYKGLGADRHMYEVIYQTAYNMGQYDKAYYILEKILSERDSMSSNSSTFDLSRVYTDNRIREMEKTNADTTFHLSATLFVVFALIMILILRYIYLRTREIQETESLKNKFLESMSHELKTPLNAISGYAQILGKPEDELGSDMHDLSNQMVNNVMLLSSLIDDIMRTTEVESETFTVNIEKVKINNICRDALHSMRHLKKEDVKISFYTDLSDDYVVNTDPNRVQQVVIHLISNALKNTDLGFVKVICSDLLSPGMITIAVEDSGCGIPPEKKDYIFQRFVKLNEFTQGSGLGLSVCLDIVKKLEGRLYLDTKYTDGARFVLEILDK